MKNRHLGEVTIAAWSAGCGLTLVLYSGIHLTTEVKSTKKKRNPVMVFEKCQLGRIHYVNMATFSQIILTSLSIPVSLGTLGRPGSTLSQRRYLLSC